MVGRRKNLGSLDEIIGQEIPGNRQNLISFELTPEEIGFLTVYTASGPFSYVQGSFNRFSGCSTYIVRDARPVSDFNNPVKWKV
jgi:hypothetical protein